MTLGYRSWKRIGNEAGQWLSSDQGIVAVGSAKALNKRIRVTVIVVKWYFRVNVYSIALLLGTVVSLALPAVRGWYRVSISGFGLIAGVGPR